MVHTGQKDKHLLIIDRGEIFVRDDLEEKLKPFGVGVASLQGIANTAVTWRDTAKQITDPIAKRRHASNARSLLNNIQGRLELLKGQKNKLTDAYEKAQLVFERQPLEEDLSAINTIINQFSILRDSIETDVERLIEES